MAVNLFPKLPTRISGKFLDLKQVTTTQRDALIPKNGMIVYNTTTTSIQAYENGAWADIAAGEVATHAALTTGVHGVTGTVLGTEDVDDVPANGATTDPISSNWAFDHEAAADPHTGYVLDSEQNDNRILMFLGV